MGDLTKWEAKSTKINIVVPIAGVVAFLALVGVMAFLKPKPPEAEKKDDKDKQAEVEEASAEEEVDWENF